MMSADVGTKLQQQTLKGLSNRHRTIQNMTKRFNAYCDKLRALNSPRWKIPLPQKLPEDINKLRECDWFVEDVWLTRTSGEAPRWYQDSRVREGIRGLLKVDRCAEERDRLGLESDNKCDWYGKELCATEVAARDKSSKCTSTTYSILLTPR